MRRTLTALALIIAAGPAAHAACKDEVATALERQRHTSGFRMQTKMLSEQGLVNMTVDYVLPNRMRQVITSTTEPKPVETVVIGRDAWSRMEGEPWRPLHPQVADALSSQMQDTLGDDAGTLGDFECLGKQALADKSFLAYQGENVEEGPKNLSPGQAEKPKLPDRPVRVIYVDPTTGLPMRSIYARANQLDKPIFEATYSYPVDIKVDTPDAPGAPKDLKPEEQKK
ncbi:MAG: hypothetical protein WDN31_14710 [Hyphomicrobium sp.]